MMMMKKIHEWKMSTGTEEKKESRSNERTDEEANDPEISISAYH